MKLKISKSQHEETTGMISKKRFQVYTLKIGVDFTDDEEIILEKYSFMNEAMILDPEISANFEVKSEMTGPAKITLGELKEGVEWSCEGYVPVQLAAIPEAVKNICKSQINTAIVRETWLGEEVIDIEL